MVFLGLVFNIRILKTRPGKTKSTVRIFYRQNYYNNSCLSNCTAVLHYKLCDNRNVVLPYSKSKQLRLTFSVPKPKVSTRPCRNLSTLNRDRISAVEISERKSAQFPMSNVCEKFHTQTHTKRVTYTVRTVPRSNFRF